MICFARRAIRNTDDLDTELDNFPIPQICDDTHDKDISKSVQTSSPSEQSQKISGKKVAQIQQTEPIVTKDRENELKFLYPKKI